jgi:SAM-dependent methyltransferase
MKNDKLYNIDEIRDIIKQHWTPYLQMTKDSFESYHESMTVSNHLYRNEDPEYVSYMLGPITRSPNWWKGKKALDFGCGCGRNIKNLLDAGNFLRVDGCDISLKNSQYSKKYVEQFYDPSKTHTWETDGYTLKPAPDEEYDYVMSHIVFQHIANYAIRLSILADIYRVLKPGGMININFMDLPPTSAVLPAVEYFYCYPPVDTEPPELGMEEFALLNCVVEDKENIINDFLALGFKDVVCHTGKDVGTGNCSYYAWGLK